MWIRGAERAWSGYVCSVGRRNSGRRSAITYGERRLTGRECVCYEMRSTGPDSQTQRSRVCRHASGTMVVQGHGGALHQEERGGSQKATRRPCMGAGARCREDTPLARGMGYRSNGSSTLGGDRTGRSALLQTSRLITRFNCLTPCAPACVVVARPHGRRRTRSIPLSPCFAWLHDNAPTHLTCRNILAGRGTA